MFFCAPRKITIYTLSNLVTILLLPEKKLAERFSILLEIVQKFVKSLGGIYSSGDIQRCELKLFSQLHKNHVFDALVVKLGK